MNIKLALPVPPGTPVTQIFGANPQDYAAWGYSGHNGIDYGTPMRTNITAAAEGRVWKIAFEDGGYGIYIILDHGGYLTYYAHLHRALVSIGQHVTVGEVIAESGSTGNSSGPHLHFGLKIPSLDNPGYKNYHNPWPYFAAVPGNAADEVETDTDTEHLTATAGAGLLVRLGPGVSYEYIGVLSQGTKIKPEKTDGDWVGYVVWSHKDYLK